MTASDPRSAVRPPPDPILVELAEYVVEGRVESEVAFETARHCLMDSLACIFQALDYPACTRLLGPTVPGAVLPGGARVPGTTSELDPVQAAFDIGVLVRWLDFNDTWLAAEWGHPSDNLGAILSLSDYRSRRASEEGGEPLSMHDLLRWMIKAYEVQGILALENAFNQVGLDHVILVRIASTAVATGILGGSVPQVRDALSNAWLDGGALRTYRHAPNTGSRKSWAAGDATSRGVRLALLTMRGEPGSPSALSAPRWGFYDVLFEGKPFRVPRDYGSYVMENILFKLSYPAEFHAQTAVEAAAALHPEVADRVDEIERIAIETQEPGMRIINKTGPLDNPADRDHCLQYMTAVALLRGDLEAADYEDAAAADEHIDLLRERMEVEENPRFTRDYYDPQKRSIANAVQVFLSNGDRTDRIEVEYPVGHRRRRDEGLPLLEAKFESCVVPRLGTERFAHLERLFTDPERLARTPVHEFVQHLVER